MHRLFGTVIITCALLLSVTQAGFSYDSPQKYGIQLGGGLGIYDMGDITLGTDYMMNENPGSKLSEEDMGPTGNIAFLYRPARHQLWEAGYSAILDVENSVTDAPDTTRGEILMHGSEFYMKAHIVTYPSEKLHLNFGFGLAYYNVELQIQDEFSGRYNYDAVGRAWGALGSIGIEYLMSDRVGLYLNGGGRLVNAANFSYESVPGVRSSVPVLGGSRQFEVNLTGAQVGLGLRVYFDKITKPIDYTR